MAAEDWITPTEDDVLTALSGAELEAFRALALADGQAEPLEQQIIHIVRMMRGYFGACPANRPLPDGIVIPPSAMEHFLALIVPRVSARVAGVMLDESTARLRSEARKAAIAWLEKVAACEIELDPDWPVAGPTGTSPTLPALGTKVPRTRRL